jgi:hypothetical protein
VLGEERKTENKQLSLESVAFQGVEEKQREKVNLFILKDSLGGENSENPNT